MTEQTFYAKCHLPQEQEVLEYRPLALEEFSQLEDYWMKREGMLFIPFNPDQHGYFFSKEEVLNEAGMMIQTPNESLTKEEYLTSVLIAQNEMKEGAMKKVVLARNEIIESDLTPEQAFEIATEIYSGSFGYLIDLGMEQWVGASPELLMHYENGLLYTVALAGTRSTNESFTEKEQVEQQMVESFIEGKLKEIGLQFVKSEKQEEVFRTIKHLKTAYTMHCTDEQALQVLKELQPTSAVCGLPREESYNFIMDFETLNRSFYSGMTGILQKDKATFFVNLRCMRFINGEVELFAGAGITADSVAEEEWMETERKIASIKAILGQ